MTISDVIARIPSGVGRPLPAPRYEPRRSESSTFLTRVGLTVESMRRHTTDEGWQLFDGLGQAGYIICGHGLMSAEPLPTGKWVADQPVTRDHGAHVHMTNVPSVLQAFDPAVVMIQDKREWTGRTAGGQRTFDGRERFSSVEALAERPDVFKLTVVKDAQHDAAFHREAAEEIGCHAWVCYYHPRIVAHLAPYVRPQHLIRTWHSVDADLVPSFRPEGRSGCLLSGALSAAYPLRQKLWAGTQHARFHDVFRLPHPGYRRDGCKTPDYLKTLSQFKVAICTCSVYGYALRKLMEATACGCRVITNLPEDEVLPEIDANLVRVPDGVTMDDLRSILANLLDDWDADFQREMAAKACAWYDFRAVGKRLAQDIESMRKSYDAN